MSPSGSGGPGGRDGTAEGHIQVLDRAFDICEELARARDPLTLSDLAQRTTMSKTTVFRILHTLVARGYAEKTYEGRYRIGPKMFDILSYHINSLELQTEARPYLATLQRDFKLDAHLGILDGPYVSYIERESAGMGDAEYTEVGYRSPAYCSSMGKCLLACLSDMQLEETLYGYRFEAFTPHTFTDRGAFVRYLHKVRRDGWAMDDEEYELGYRCIAAPVFDYRGNAIAAAGLSGTTESISDDRVPVIAQRIKTAARSISTRMGYLE